MKCPYCRASTTDVFNSRPTRFGAQVWRRRRCLSCNESFTTYEAVDLGFLKIEKRSGKRQRYSRAKLYSSIYGSFIGEEANQNDIDAVTDTIESALLDAKQDILTTVEIAETALQTLKRYHTAAFVRYLANQADLVSPAQLKRELKKY